jgi:TRAP-type C4-dicarboxylate transport system permease small subunit
METALTYIEKMSKWMQAISGVVLTCLMLLTTADVIGRIFDHPIIGTYDFVGLGGAIVLGFGLPVTSWARNHICVEFLYEKWSPSVQKAATIITRLIGIVLFVFIGWNLYKLGYDLQVAGEVTLTRHLPFHPVAYALAVCCLGQIVVLVGEILKVVGGHNE